MATLIEGVYLHAVAVVDLVHAEVKYVFGATGVHTRASEAWEQRSGVCQDMAHLVLGALRSVGIPARYVSGYLMPSRSGELGVPYAGESHAWIQFWDDGWVGADPTNNIRPGDLHVEVAVGRDYRDVAPLTGIFTGSFSRAGKPSRSMSSTVVRKATNCS